MSSNSSRHYYQGGYDYDFLDGLSSRHECPICLLCQRDPHQTSCGHRFCRSCILTWLNEGKTCPHDNCSLGEGDIFPDAMAHREIMQLMVKCPKPGCEAVVRLSDAENHAKSSHNLEDENQSQTCTSCGELVLESLASNQHNLVCPNVLVACPLASAGCQDKIKRSELSSHVQLQTSRHVQLLSEKLEKLQQLQQVVGGGEDQQPLAASEDVQKLLRDLYSRMVSVEQSNCQLTIANEQLAKKVAAVEASNNGLEDEEVGRYCQGKYVWTISDFSVHHDKMRRNRSFVIYSRGFYTGVFGYKLCLRCNVHIIDGQEHLGIFVHVMKGLNDHSVDWPFSGKIRLSLKHPDRQQDFTETMTTPPEGLSAFERPIAAAVRNPTGFGLQQFIHINTLFTDGFLGSDDTLVVKADVMSDTVF